MANKRLIDANALMAEHCNGCATDIQAMCKNDPVCASMMWIVEAPTVDAVEVVHGRWLIHKGHFHDFAECSLCGEDYVRDTAMAMNYCPNCGAKMDVTKD